MSTYEKPIIVDADGTFEGVYAASGDIWSPEVYWADHNSGHLSSIDIKLHKSGGNSGEHVKVTITFTDLQHTLVSIGGGSMDMSGVSYGGNTIVIDTNCHYNETAEICFNLNNMVFDTTFVDENKQNQGGAYYPGPEKEDHKGAVNGAIPCTVSVEWT